METDTTWQKCVWEKHTNTIEVEKKLKKDTDYVLLCDLQEFVCIEHIWSALIRLTILYKSKRMLRAYSILSHGEKKR